MRAGKGRYAGTQLTVRVRLELANHLLNRLACRPLHGGQHQREPLALQDQAPLGAKRCPTVAPGDRCPVRSSTRHAA